MPKYRKRTWADHLGLLDFLVNHTVKEASTHFRISIAAVGSWLYKMRKEIDETQSALNRIRTLQRISKRVRKITTSSEVKKEESEEDTENF